MNEKAEQSEKKKVVYRISVRDLVERTCQSGDLNLERFIGGNRALLGIRAHQKIQKSRPEEYAKEVTISHLIERKNYFLQIGGRIDGVFQYPQKTIIEEIKSTSVEPEYFRRNENPLHWAQAKVYAYFYASQHNLAKIEVRLTYFQIETAKTSEFHKHFKYNELENFVNGIIGKYTDFLEKNIDWKIRRNYSIKNLQFPFENYRRGQREMAIAVYKSIKNSRQLMIQAPTGIGKTTAVLFPAIKALAENKISEIFYLTPKSTGKNNAEKSLRLMQENGLKLRFLTLTAKDKICFKPDSACNPDECEFAKGFFDRLDEAIAAISRQNDFTREIVEKFAMKYRICPFEFSLSLALLSDCIICDYNYVFDPRVYLRRFFEEENISPDTKYAFLIDEAHNLVERSRTMFSAEIFKQKTLELRKQIKGKLPEIYQNLSSINSWFLKKKKEIPAAENFSVAKGKPESLFPFLKKFAFSSEKWLAKNLPTSFRQNLLEYYFEILNFLRIAEFYGENYQTYFEKIGKDIKIKIFCIDPSPLLETALKRGKSSVFFSATLSPMDYFQNLFGCDEDMDKLSLLSPFPQENLKIFIARKISTRFKDRQKTKEKIFSLIRKFVERKRGNYLVFFPSFEYLNLIYEIFQTETQNFEIAVQESNMSEHKRANFLAQFNHKNIKTLVGFAVLGGVFGEGIDLVGKRLDGAVIVGVGLPKISFERNLIKSYFDRLEKGFSYAYIFPGMNKILQAAGRVIRTETDEGRILLIGDRYMNYRFKSLLPKEWRMERLE